MVLELSTVVGKGSRLSLGLRSPGADPATEKSAGVAGSTYWVCKVVPFLVCFILLKLNMCVHIFPECVAKGSRFTGG